MYKQPRIIQFITFMALSLGLILLTGMATAGNSTGKGTQPNGKPFLAIQEQIANLSTFLDEELAAVWTRVDELQAAIDLNNERDDAQTALIALLGATLDELETRVAVNEESIRALEVQDVFLNALIAALQLKTDDLQRQIYVHGDRIDLLILQDRYLQELISYLSHRVALLEFNMERNNADIFELQNQMRAAQRAIEDKQERIWGWCGTNRAIQRINSDGSVVCVDSGAGGFTSLVVSQVVDDDDAFNGTLFDRMSISATCPVGSHLTGGGFDSEYDLGYVYASAPFPNNRGWKVSFRGSWPSHNEVEVMAVCLRAE